MFLSREQYSEVNIGALYSSETNSDGKPTKPKTWFKCVKIYYEKYYFMKWFVLSVASLSFVGASVVTCNCNSTNGLGQLILIEQAQLHIVARSHV